MLDNPGRPLQNFVDWLKELGMSEYTERYTENHIDFSALGARQALPLARKAVSGVRSCWFSPYKEQTTSLPWTRLLPWMIMGSLGGAIMDIGEWLRSLGLGKYEVAFRENEIDDETVLPKSDCRGPSRTLASLSVGHRAQAPRCHRCTA